MTGKEHNIISKQVKVRANLKIRKKFIIPRMVLKLKDVRSPVNCFFQAYSHLLKD